MRYYLVLWRFLLKRKILVAVILIAVLVVVISSLKGGRDLKFGMTEGKFTPCPGTPNCVSSQAESKDEYIEPISTGGADTEAVMEIVKIAVEKSDRVKVVEYNGSYLRVEFKSLIFRFIDDVEFYHDAEKALLHFKSASRVGKSDLGVNRKRMEKLKVLILDELGKLPDGNIE
jgi:uncharacterized protein (DUF1499 family)